MVILQEALPVQGLDIGPESCKAFAAAIRPCKTLLWNGPMGVFEVCPAVQQPTQEQQAKAIAAAAAAAAWQLLGRSSIHNVLHAMQPECSACRSLWTARSCSNAMVLLEARLTRFANVPSLLASRRQLVHCCCVSQQMPQLAKGSNNLAEATAY